MFSLYIIVTFSDERRLNMGQQKHDNRLIDQKVEQLCLKGCKSVREDIKLLERGVILPEIQNLNQLGRENVLKELQAIMAVYGDACPLDRNIKI